ncbi:hypothetical protein Cgig2_009364 [Carnegiea gigantea]|uniref:Cupin type-1 domain-containing protein n=1 Tax=Carnegiea gigantea TaxID=171969 RepID=A0A9Q1GUG4_9CARY|nr:hypothetical protein Cgig2_009364 [Carnegiea gigantea]
MNLKPNHSCTTLILILLTLHALASVTAEEAVGFEDAEKAYERCQQRCRGTGQQQWQCQRSCQDQYEAALEREREHRHRDHGHGGGDRYPRPPQERDYRHCARECERREEGFPRQRQCKLRCEEEFGGRGRRGHHEGGRSIHERDDNRRRKTKEKESETENPYYFDSNSFESRYSTKEGHMRVLQRFAERSDLLRGIDKFRVGFYEANPNTFMLPHHWDADSVLFVIRGRATMTFLRQENRETFDLERGDVLIIPAGTTAYLVNSHENEMLQIAELLHPQYFGVGGEEPESFFNSFSTEILQAALNVPREQLERLFKQQKGGAIVKARQEQVRALARHGMSTGGMRESRGPFNLLDEGPRYSNDHGEFFVVSPNEYPLLKDLDVSVAYCNIRQGSMMAPHYNSRTTIIVMVEEGSGYIEMACPHLGARGNRKEEQEGASPSYKKVKACLSRGDAFVVPVGHPVALVASENENLRAVGFGINAYNNQMNFLAGQENIINLLDREAKELSFNLPAEEVEEMFQRQRKSVFMAGPQREQSALVSIVDFAGF